MSINSTIADLCEADFITVGVNETETDIKVRPSISFWKDVWRRLRKNKPAMAGLTYIIIIGIGVIFLPMISNYAFTSIDFNRSNLSMSVEHFFGTDNMGRDMWTRIWVGGRISVIMGFCGAILPALMGIIIGGLCGYYGGKLDMIVLRIIDIMICIPSMIFIILIMLYLGSGPFAIVLAVAISGWTGFARGSRIHVLRLKNLEFVLASKALGASPARLIFKHMFPNFIGIMLVGITMFIPSVIFMEAFLSFMGLGVAPPMTSWGQLCQLGTMVFREYPLQLVIPALFISFYMLAFNLLGDGIRDALDPRLRDT
ncbi:MAG: ABC transporter permease [Treponema sp.]|nr:ABC transporter permease [Treponema sp.]